MIGRDIQYCINLLFLVDLLSVSSMYMSTWVIIYQPNYNVTYTNEDVTKLEAQTL